MKSIAFVFALLLPLASFAKVGPLEWVGNSRPDRVTATTLGFYQTRDGRIHLARVERTAAKRNYLRVIEVRNCRGLQVVPGDFLACRFPNGAMMNLGKFQRGDLSAVEAQVLVTGQVVKAALLKGGQFKFANSQAPNSLSVIADVVPVQAAK